MQTQYGSAYRKGMGREALYRRYGDRIIARPVDKRENYIKRCVAIAGDTLEIRQREIYINGAPSPAPKGVQYQYIVNTDGNAYIHDLWKKYRIYDVMQFPPHGYIIHTTPENAALIGSGNIPGIRSVEFFPQHSDKSIFPQDTSLFQWGLDNFGPIVIPKAGMTVTLTPANIALYRRAIEVYEGNRFEVADGKVMINGVHATTYTFKMDYYWLMGDNRHNSLDSRYWGFVPEDHVVGKAVFVWFSMDKHRGWFDGKVRWNKVFRKAN
jgi:signal peptidase I